MIADRLRQAATVLRERAEAATPGEWIVDPYAAEMVERRGVGEYIADAYGYDRPQRQSNAAYIATVHPGVGLALADILDGLATNLPDWEPGKRAADLILGGDPS